MNHNPCWEANISWDNKKIPRFLWNPIVHYRAQNSAPLVRIAIPTKPVKAPHTLRLEDPF